ncbi:MAG: hypothetical protein WDZ88_01135 [Candidatus Paceibacterota bacterium]
MNTVSRVITGTILTVGGIFLSLVAISNGFWVFLVYGVPIIVVGVLIFFNTEEDDIEDINK